MSPGGIHPDTDLPTRDDQRSSDAFGSRTVAGVAVELEQLSDRLEELGIEFAALVRDGGDDARPGWSARDAMLAAGRLAHSAEVIGSVAYLQADVTGCSADDGV